MPESEVSVLQLPPLVLHPFSNSNDLDKLTVFPGVDVPASLSFETRYSEIRMLCFIGKDLDRWLAHCLEFLGQSSEATAHAISEADLIRLLLFETPEPVQVKLTAWGIKNFESVFTPALGLSQIFSHPPEPWTLAPRFVERFREYAGLLYRIRVESQEPKTTAMVKLSFEMYSSKEYIAMFEKDWDGASNLNPTTDM